MTDFTQYVKNNTDIEAMRESGRRTAAVLAFIRPHVKPGITTEKLDRLCHEYIVDNLGDIPAPLNYRGFPKSICTSVNHVICHGIPKPSEKLKNGDIVNIDVSVIHNGFHGDSPARGAKFCVSIEIGKIDTASRSFCIHVVVLR